MSTRRIVGITSLAAMLVLTACTTSHVDNPALSAPPSVPITGTATATTGAPTPCSLVATAVIKGAFGGDVTSGQSPATATRPECDWSITGSALGGDVELVLYFPPVQSSAAFHAAKSGLPGAVIVAELGTDAYYLAAQYALTVLVGANQFTVQAIFPSGSSAKPDPADVQLDLINVARFADASY
jgi:hypothetical protein